MWEAGRGVSMRLLLRRPVVAVFYLIGWLIVLVGDADDRLRGRRR